MWIICTAQVQYREIYIQSTWFQWFGIPNHSVPTNLFRKRLDFTSMSQFPVPDVVSQLLIALRWSSPSCFLIRSDGKLHHPDTRKNPDGWLRWVVPDIVQKTQWRGFGGGNRQLKISLRVLGCGRGDHWSVRFYCLLGIIFLNINISELLRPNYSVVFSSPWSTISVV